MTDQPTLWGIHAGKSGDAHRLFMDSNCIAVGWAKVPDLRQLEATRDALKKEIAEAYPDYKSGAIPVQAGQLYRFGYEMTVGDLVAYPSKFDRMIHMGRVTGDYFCSNDSEPGYTHRRDVKWLNSLSRTRFSQGALYEIGSALSLFQIKNYSDEFLAALAGDIPDVIDPDDPTIGIVAEEIEGTTRDFIVKRLARDLKGHPFADFVGHLLEAMGYRTRISPEGPDGGIDIVAHKDELGFEPPIIKVQVKSTEGSVGDPVVSALYGKVGESEYGLLVTLGTITTQAKNFAQLKSNLRLIDGDELVSLVLEHYEEFNSKYKGLLPLRKVYVPEPLEESEDG